MGIDIFTLREGNGFVSPQFRDEVVLHYVLLDPVFPDGRTIDSSRVRKSPLRFLLGYRFEVPKGLEMALEQMCVGQRARVTISPDLAWGKEGIKGAIPPDSTVVYDLELLAVNCKNLSHDHYHRCPHFFSKKY